MQVEFSHDRIFHCVNGDSFGYGACPVTGEYVTDSIGAFSDCAVCYRCLLLFLLLRLFLLFLLPLPLLSGARARAHACTCVFFFGWWALSF